LAAIAESHYGNLAEVRNSQALLFVTVNEGIGTGIVLDGRLYSGPAHAAGEFGQMVISDGGAPGELDGPGCLEQLASCTALLERYSRLNGKSGAMMGGGHTAARVRKICQLAMGGEQAATKALEQTCLCLGLGLSNMIWGINPDVIVVDSPMNEAWPMVMTSLRAQFPHDKEIVNFRHLIVRPSSLAGNATIIGAGTLPFQHLFVAGERIRQAGLNA
jgi:predicted NBD/HSP70 family sugar kinase